MGAFRRSMSSVNAGILAFFLCIIVALVAFGILRALYGTVSLEKQYDEPLEEKAEVSDLFLGKSMSVEAQEVSVGKVSWAYTGSDGPVNWGDLHSSFRLCREGRQQSPVDIRQAKLSSKLLHLKFHYHGSDVSVVNTGRGLSASFDNSGYVMLDGIHYELTGMTWHVPSEHHVDGIPYEVEVQLTHRTSDGQVMIIAIFGEEGQIHDGILGLWEQLPQDVQARGPALPFDPSTLLPRTHTYFEYRGSMTTPPCREGIRWIVMTRPMGMSAQQIDRLTKVSGYNARPTQPLGARSVLRSRR